MTMRILAVLLLIAINAFFVAAEFSIVSVRRSRINQLVLVGDVQAKTVQDLQRGLDRLLSTTQFGITLASLALGWIGESTMAVAMASLLVKLPLPPPTQQFLAHSLAVPLAFGLIAYLQIVLGELCPKSLALIYSEQLARFLGPPSVAIARLFNPFIWVLNQSTRWLLQWVGVRYTGQGWYHRVTPEELQLIISTITESPDLEEEERELLSNVFAFAEVTAGEVMVPRTSLVAVSIEASFQELLQEVANAGHSRYPVMRESLDDVVGLIAFKDLAEPWVTGALQLDQPIRSWVRPAQFVSEEMPLNELLDLMQRSGQPLVMVVDNFGGTAGLVTIQDVVAELIGDAPDAESPAEPNIRLIDDQTYLVQAQTDLEEVNDFLNLELPLSEDYQTLGGFVIYQLQKIPAAGEGLTYQTCEITVESGEGPRLENIRVRRLEPSMMSEVTEDLSDLTNLSDLTDRSGSEAALPAESPSAESSPESPESRLDSSGLDSE